MQNLRNNIIKFAILFILIFLASKSFAGWETTGNDIVTGDYIGTTNGQALVFKAGSLEKLKILPGTLGNTEMRVQASTLFSLQNQSGQFILNHNGTTGGTALFGFNGSKMVGISLQGVEIIGAPLHYKTNYTVSNDGGTYSATAYDYTIESQGGEVVLPSATGIKGKRYEIVNASSSDLPVHSVSLIGNFEMTPVYQLLLGRTLVVVSNGSVWRIISN